MFSLAPIGDINFSESPDTCTFNYLARCANPLIFSHAFDSKLEPVIVIREKKFRLFALNRAPMWQKETSPFERTHKSRTSGFIKARKKSARDHEFSPLYMKAGKKSFNVRTSLKRTCSPLSTQIRTYGKIYNLFVSGFNGPAAVPFYSVVVAGNSDSPPCLIVHFAASRGSL